MERALVNSIAALGRRRFVSRLASGSAAILAGAFARQSRVEAHDERQTIVPATLGGQWGIVSYRLRQSGRGTADERVVTQLLGGGGVVLGEFERSQHFRVRTEKTRKDGEVYRKTKREKRRETVELLWGRETLEIRTDADSGNFAVRHDGRNVGSATVTSESQIVEPALLALTTERAELFELSSAVGLDLTRALPEPVRETEGCCCGDVECLGQDFSCTVYDFQRSVACYNAEGCVGGRCWNSLCAGCCQLFGCDCVCAPASNFFCFCYYSGYSCSCRTYCQ